MTTSTNELPVIALKQAPAAGASDVVAICTKLREVCGRDAATGSIRPTVSVERDALLAEYRVIVQRQITADARRNLAAIETLAEETSDQVGLRLKNSAVGGNLLRSMRASLERIDEVDPYTSTANQDAWWFALHQFYFDGLWLAEHLQKRGDRRSAGWWQRTPKRREVQRWSLIGRWQSLNSLIEMSVPRYHRVKLLGTFGPSIAYLVSQQTPGSKGFSFYDFFETTLGWLRRGGFEQIGDVHSPAVEWVDVDRLINNELIELRTGRTRHNIIIMISHRLGFLDMPLCHAPLRRIRLAAWANNSFYGPGMEHKLNADPYTIAVSGNNCPPMRQSITRTAEVLVKERMPVAILGDGGQPPVFYGQQMGIKAGIRLALKAAVRASAGTGRRTYVAPISMNDPVAFVQGTRQRIRVRFHEPVLIEADDVTGRDAARAGDPLINQLEAAFLLDTAHAEDGLPRPRIIPAVRERLRRISQEPMLKRLFVTSLTDLARHAARQSIHERAH